MKTQITNLEGLTNNHNLGGLKVTAQIVAGQKANHNLGGLKVKPQIVAGQKANHNLGGLKVKTLTYEPHGVLYTGRNHNLGRLISETLNRVSPIAYRQSLTRIAN